MPSSPFPSRRIPSHRSSSRSGVSHLTDPHRILSPSSRPHRHSSHPLPNPFVTPFSPASAPHPHPSPYWTPLHTHPSPYCTTLLKLTIIEKCADVVLLLTGNGFDLAFEPIRVRRGKEDRDTVTWAPDGDDEVERHGLAAACEDGMPAVAPGCRSPGTFSGQGR